MSADATRPIAVITGAGGGVGQALAERLAHDGHRLVLTGRDASKLEQVAAGLDTPVMCIAADLTDPDAPERIFGQVESEWGQPEVLVANAGASAAAPVTDTSDADWQRLLDINMTAPFRCIRRALPGMRQAGYGRIVLVASVVAKRGERQVSAYTASKHGALGLIRAVADEVARTGVTVNAVCPGYINTPMTDATVQAIAARQDIDAGQARRILERRQPIGRLIEPSEVAAAVSSCIANGAINGQGINIDGGAVQS